MSAGPWRTAAMSLAGFVELAVSDNTFASPADRIGHPAADEHQAVEIGRAFLGDGCVAHAG